MFGIYNSNRDLNLIDQKNYKILLFFFSGIEYILVNRDQSFSRISRERKSLSFLNLFKRYTSAMLLENKTRNNICFNSRSFLFREHQVCSFLAQIVDVDVKKGLGAEEVCICVRGHSFFSKKTRDTGKSKRERYIFSRTENFRRGFLFNRCCCFD